MKISFDFDGTLEYVEAQQIAEKLMSEGHDVCILTTRYSDPSRYHFNAEALHRKLFEVAGKVGITEIHFTEMKYKYESIDNYNIDIHIDDNYKEEVYLINHYCKAKAIWYNYGWTRELYKFINAG